MILRASSLKPKSLAARRVASECQKLSNPAAGEASTAHSMSSTTNFCNMAGILNCSVAKSKPTTETRRSRATTKPKTHHPSADLRAGYGTETRRKTGENQLHRGGAETRRRGEEFNFDEEFAQKTRKFRISNTRGVEPQPNPPPFAGPQGTLRH